MSNDVSKGTDNETDTHTKEDVDTSKNPLSSILTFGTGCAAVSEITAPIENPTVTDNLCKHVRHTGAVFPKKELGILARKGLLALKKGPK